MILSTVFKIKVPAGEASIAEDTYGPVFDALEEGPKTLGELFELPELRKQKELSPIEVAGVLVGSDQAVTSFYRASAKCDRLLCASSHVPFA